MDGPSDSLRQRLVRLGVSETAVQTAARRHLAAIARDLPPFDSAFVDACLRDQLLTRWQADVLCSSRPGRVFFGPFVLRSRRLQDGPRTSYEATHTETGGRCEVTILEDALHALPTLQTLAGSAKRKRSAAVTISGADQVDGRVVLVAPATEGPTLAELLIRRGRLAPAEVATIAHGLLAGLRDLHATGDVHGNVRTSTVRLAPGSQPVRLMLPGVQPCVAPIVVYRAGLPLASCENVPPERIGTQRPADVASDLFGVGCVLWELLAGRSPFPPNGSLGRLRAQLQCSPPPLADFAGDVPPSLASLVAACLKRDPADRPATAAEALAMIARTPSQTVAVRAASKRPRSKLATGLYGTAAMLTLAVGTLAMQSRLDLISPLQPSVSQAAEVATTGLPGDALTLRPLPPPSADGRIDLPPGRYAASEIAWGGPLVVAGQGDVVLEVDGSWNAVAESITLRGITLEAKAAVGPVLTAQSQNFTADGVTVEAGSRRVAMSWQPLDGGDVSGRVVTMTHCRLSAATAAIALEQPARMVRMSDCVVDAASVLLWSHDWPRREAGVQLTHCLVRRARSVVAATGAVASSAQRLAVLADHCVFDPVVTDAQGGVAVVRIGDVAELAEVRRRVAVEVVGSVSRRVWSRVACAGVPVRDDDRLPIPVGELWIVGDQLDDAAASLPADVMPGIRPRQTTAAEDRRPAA